MTEAKNTLEAIIEKIHNEDRLQLLAGLTLLAKDLNEYMAVNAYYGSDTQLFNQIYASTFDANRIFWSSLDSAPGDENHKPEGSMLYAQLEDSGMPHGFAEQALSPNFDATPLLKPKEEVAGVNINQEWTRHPGWALLQAFRAAFCEVLCKNGRPVRQYVDSGSDDRKKLANAIAGVLVREKFSTAAYWRPFIAQLSVLIAKTDVAGYCASCKPANGAG